MKRSYLVLPALILACRLCGATEPPAPNTLTAAEQAAGWRLLFNGKDLGKWHNFRREGVRPGWQVKEGTLACVDPHNAGNLVTPEEFDWFELQLDYNIASGGNSGVIYHISTNRGGVCETGPEVQLLDNAAAGDDVQSGWLYGLYRPPDDPKTGKPLDATKPAGEWNHLRVLITPEKCEHEINGVNYFEYVLGSEDFKARVTKSKFAVFPDFGQYERRYIALQGDHGQVSFRNLKLRPITRQAAQTNDPSPRYSLTVRAERAGAIYKVGESVRFNLSLQQDGQPVDGEQVEWTLSKDGVPPTQRGRIMMTQGEAAVTGQLDEPGFLQCRVVYQPPSGAALTALGGAGVDPLQIKPSLPVPEDFDAFWSEQKQKLAAVPPNPQLSPVLSKDPEIECLELKADCIGAPVSGYLAKPRGAKPKSLPIIMTVHGAGVSSSSLSGPVGWARKDFLALDINAHGLPNGQPARFYSELAKGELKDYPIRGRESRETVYFLGMFLRLVRAIDVLTAQPEWDGRTVVVHGSSQGGAQAIVAAGLDPRVSFFAAGVPAMCDHSGSVVRRISGWPKLVPVDADGKADSKVLEAARYYDAASFATRTRAAGILTVGFIDTTCPPTGVYAAYNALMGAKEIYNDPLGKHTVSVRAVEAMQGAIRRHAQTKTQQ